MSDAVFASVDNTVAETPSQQTRGDT